MNTKSLNILKWFIEESKRNKWQLIYDEKLSLNTFGIIDYTIDTGEYEFKPVLYNGFKVYGVVAKTI